MNLSYSLNKLLSLLRMTLGRKATRGSVLTPCLWRQTKERQSGRARSCHRKNSFAPDSGQSTEPCTTIKYGAKTYDLKIKLVLFSTLTFRSLKVALWSVSSCHFRRGRNIRTTSVSSRNRSTWVWSSSRSNMTRLEPSLNRHYTPPLTAILNTYLC